MIRRATPPRRCGWICREHDPFAGYAADVIDTHCHLTYDGLAERVGDVIADAQAAGVDGMVSVGTHPQDASKALELAGRYDSIFATAGVHPHYAANVTDPRSVRAFLLEVADHPRLVALGEMGLDWHYPDPPRDIQKQVFELQLRIMAERPDLPGIIHNREATDDTLAMIQASGLPGDRFVFHCFTGEPDEVERILAIGARVGFTGIVTFKSAKNVAEASDRVPLDRLMIATDSPYLTPAPHRKVRPNEPKYVPLVAEFLAERRDMSVGELTAATDANARGFYRWPAANAD